MKSSPTDRNLLKVVAKTFRVIEVIAQHPNGIQLGDLSRLCEGQPKATVFRILYTLKKLGYVHQSEQSGAYRLTQQIEWLGRTESRETLKRGPPLSRATAGSVRTNGSAGRS